MKTARILAISALLALPLAAQNPGAQPMPMEMARETVTVTGEATVSSPPDEVSFTAGVQSVAQTVDAAVAENNRQTRAIIDALKRAGATDAEIRTSNFSIWPQQDYAEGRPPRITGFVVSNQVTVTKKDPAAASRLLTAAVTAGANNVSGLQMGLSSMDGIRAEGLRQAYVNARARAQVLAEASGRSLGRALTIREGGIDVPTPPPYVRSAMAMEAKASMDVPVEAGMQESRFVVNVVFELR